MKKLLENLQKIENGIMVVTFSIMVICAFAQVINRNFIHASAAWFDEAATYAMIYMVLVGTEVGLRDGTQIAVTTLVEKIGGKGQAALEILAKVVILIFSANVFYWGLQLVARQVANGQTSAALNLPMSVPYAALVVGFSAIFAVQLAAVIKMVMNLAHGENDGSQTEPVKNVEEVEV